MIGSDSLSQPCAACQAFCPAFFFFQAKNLPFSAGFRFIVLFWNISKGKGRAEHGCRSPAPVPPPRHGIRRNPGLFFFLRNEREAACAICEIT
jgi:hypothetical protein